MKVVRDLNVNITTTKAVTVKTDLKAATETIITEITTTVAAITKIVNKAVTDVTTKVAVITGKAATIVTEAVTDRTDLKAVTTETTITTTEGRNRVDLIEADLITDVLKEVKLQSSC